MRLVIEIPKDIYKETLRTDIWDDYEKRRIRFAIRNGKRLPKRHGDLIDRNAVIQSAFDKADNYNAYEEAEIVASILRDTPVIIEADKGR